MKKDNSKTTEGILLRLLYGLLIVASIALTAKTCCDAQEAIAKVEDQIAYDCIVRK